MEILWNEGPVVGKATYKVNDNYVWDFDVNIVQVKILVDPAETPDENKTNMVKISGFPNL